MQEHSATKGNKENLEDKRGRKKKKVQNVNSYEVRKKLPPNEAGCSQPCMRTIDNIQLIPA